MRNITFPGSYGSHKTPCDVHAVKSGNGFWYAVDGSRNVNFTLLDLSERTRRVDVEALPDTDFFTASRPITCPEDIERELDE